MVHAQADFIFAISTITNFHQINNFHKNLNHS